MELLKIKLYPWVNVLISQDQSWACLPHSISSFKCWKSPSYEHLWDIIMKKSCHTSCPSSGRSGARCCSPWRPNSCLQGATPTCITSCEAPCVKMTVSVLFWRWEMVTAELVGAFFIFSPHFSSVLPFLHSLCVCVSQHISDSAHRGCVGDITT